MGMGRWPITTWLGEFKHPAITSYELGHLLGTRRSTDSHSWDLRSYVSCDMTQRGISLVRRDCSHFMVLNSHMGTEWGFHWVQLDVPRIWFLGVSGNGIRHATWQCKQGKMMITPNHPFQTKLHGVPVSEHHKQWEIGHPSLSVGFFK